MRWGVGAKVKHSGFELWIDCMDGDKKAWAEMKRYQIQDVQLLDKLYEVLIPWLPGNSSVTSKEKQEISEQDKVVQ